MISSYVRILNYKEADDKGISLLIKLKFVKENNSVLITFIIFVYYMETIDCFFVMMLLFLQRYVISYMDASQRYTLFAIY